MAESEKRSAFKKVFTYVLLLAMVLLAVVIFLLVGIGRALFSLPEPKVDYVAKANELSRPADYDANQNAVFDYAEAFATVTAEPNEIGLTRVWPGDMNEVKREVLEDYVKKNSEALEHLARGSRKPYYWVEYEGPSLREAELGDLLGCKHAGLAEWWRAKLKAANGAARGALEEVLVCYKIGRHLGGVKSLSEQIVGMQIRLIALEGFRDILARVDVDGETLAWFAGQLDATVAGDTGGIDFTIERLRFEDLVQRMYTGGFVGDRIMSIRAATKYDMPWELVSKAGALETYDEIYEYYERLKSRTPYEIVTQGEDVEDQIREIAGGNSFSYSMTQPLEKMRCAGGNEWLLMLW